MATTGNLLGGPVHLKRGISRFGGFAVGTVVSAVPNILAIPILVSSIGAAAWTAIAVGQSLGMVASILVTLGWGVVGPSEVARARPGRARRIIYLRSMIFRILALGPCLIGAIAVSIAVAPDGLLTPVILATVGATLTGLTAAWYFSGTGKPLDLMVCETAPRAAIILAGAGATYYVPDPAVFPGFLIAATLVTTAISSLVALRGVEPFEFRRGLIEARRRWRKIMLEQASGVTTTAISTGYRDLPLVVLASVKPAAAPAYALIDRILKLAQAGARPVMQVFQGWVPAVRDLVLQRSSVALRVSGAMAVAAGTLFSICAVALGGLLGAEEITLTTGLVVPAGLALAMSMVSQTAGLACLVSLGQARWVAISATLGAVVCAVLLIPFIQVWGPSGAMWAVVAAEFCVLIVRLLSIARVKARHRGMVAEPAGGVA
jgi:O-antigen/teichoic acid export membrane protein